MRKTSKLAWAALAALVAVLIIKVIYDLKFSPRARADEARRKFSHLVKVSNVTVRGPGMNGEITATIENVSGRPIESVKLKLVRYDADYEEDGWASVPSVTGLAVGEVRELSAPLFIPAPPGGGSFALLVTNVE